MTKALIVSDTHGTEANLIRALHREAPVTKIVHLGDLLGLEENIESMTGIPCFMVKGNCDTFSMLPAESVIMMGSHRTFITHGHYYAVDYGHSEVIRHARAMDCDTVMFGHTHVPFVEEENGMLVMNPGSLTRPRQPNRCPSYIVAEIEDNGEVRYEIKYL